jgi:integrase
MPWALSNLASDLAPRAHHPQHVENEEYDSGKTCYRELNVIRGCFSRAVEWCRLLISPMKAVKPYRVDNVRMRVLSPDEIKRVLESCRPALQLIARTTLESLPRLSEVLNLRVEDLGPDYATIVQTKSGKSRRVPPTSELKAELLKQAHKSGYIFGQGKDGKPPQQKREQRSEDR